MEILLVLVISFAATAAGAVTGIGGGVIIKPVMDAVANMDVVTVSFLSGCTVLAMSCVSLVKNRKGAALDFKKSTFLAIGAAVGGVVGKAVFDAATRSFEGSEAVGAVQSGILVAITAGVFVYTLKKSRIKTRDVKSPAARLLIGLLLGLISAFLGIGGGPINIAVLSYFFSMDSKTAAANSLYIIFFSQTASLLSTVAVGAVPAFDPFMLVAMIAAGVLGGVLGGILSKRMSHTHVDVLFCAVMAVIICISVYNMISFASAA